MIVIIYQHNHVTYPRTDYGIPCAMIIKVMKFTLGHYPVHLGHKQCRNIRFHSEFVPLKIEHGISSYNANGTQPPSSSIIKKAQIKKIYFFISPWQSVGTCYCNEKRRCILCLMKQYQPDRTGVTPKRFILVESEKFNS